MVCRFEANSYKKNRISNELDADISIRFRSVPFSFETFYGFTTKDLEIRFNIEHTQFSSDALKKKKKQQPLK